MTASAARSSSSAESSGATAPAQPPRAGRFAHEVRVARRDQVRVLYPELVAEPLDLVVLRGEVGSWLRHRLQLQVAAQTLHLVQVDPHAFPDQESSPLCNGDERAECGIEGLP
jgi:hypothetical protein